MGVGAEMGWCVLTPRNIEGSQPARQAQRGGEAQNSLLLCLKPNQRHPGTHVGLLDSGTRGKELLLCEATQSGAICSSSRRKQGSQRAWPGNDGREEMRDRREWGEEVGPGGTRSRLSAD